MYNSIWYDSLVKPFLNPPAYVFPPVWTLLYVMLLIALILFSVRISRRSKLKGYIYFIIQLILNLLWSPAFFVLHKIGLALIIVILLDISVFLLIIEFARISRISGIIRRGSSVSYPFGGGANSSQIVTSSNKPNCATLQTLQRFAIASHFDYLCFIEKENYGKD